MADNLRDIAEALRMGLAQQGGFVRPVSGRVFMGSGGNVDPDALAMYLAGALGLTQEQRTLEDGYGGQSFDRQGNRVPTPSKPCTRQSRWATRWSTDA